MINLIHDRASVSVDELAAVTFTRKAAAELRPVPGRARKGRARGDGASRRNDWSGGQACRACVSGHHPLVLRRLLRERPVEAGVDSEFTELDDALDRELRRRAWSEHAERLIAGDDPLVGTLDDLGVEIGQLSSTFERFADYPDVDLWPADQVALPDPEPVLGALRILRGPHQIARAVSSARCGQRQAYSRSFGGCCESPPGELSTARRSDRGAEPVQESPPAIVQKNWPGGKPRRWPRRKPGRGSPAPRDTIRPGDATGRYRLFSKPFGPAVEIYDRLRRDAGGLNFQDLLLTAAKMLRENPAIRRYFRKRFSHLLMDEFQDTDPIQAEVMLLSPPTTRTRPTGGAAGR